MADNMADNMVDVEKNNMKETYKSRSLPTQLQVIPKPILQKLQDDIDNPINVIVDNKEYTETEIKNHVSKYKCLNRDVFEAFYEDYIDFKSYINDILKSNFNHTILQSTDDDSQEQEPQQQEDNDMINTTNELNGKIQLLQEENNRLKQENKTFLKIIKLIPQQSKQVKDLDNETHWKVVRLKQKCPETFHNTEINNTVPLRLSNSFQSLEQETDFSRVLNSPEEKKDLVNTNRKDNQNKTYLKNHKEVKTTKKIVPGNRSYAETTTYGRKVLFIGDSHVNRINRRKLNYSFSKRAKCILKPFRGAKIEDLEHYIIPNLQQQNPDIVVIHVGSNNVSYNYLDGDARSLAANVVKIGKKCIEYGVAHVVISGIFVKDSIRLSAFIRKVNNELCELCSTNNFHFVSNDNIIRKDLCGDGTNIFVGNIVNYLNRNILGINQY